MNEQDKTAKTDEIPYEFMEMWLHMCQLRRYGDFQVLESDNQSQAPTTRTFLMPPWIIHREDYTRIGEMLSEIVKISTSEGFPDNPSEEGFERKSIVFQMRCAICKIIVLINFLAISYNYYQVKEEQYPGFSPASLLDPLQCRDLHYTLLLMGANLSAKLEDDPFLKDSLKADVQYVMNVMFAVLSGMLPDSKEIGRLQEDFAFFLDYPGNPMLFNKLRHQFGVVSRAFAAEQPKWERKKLDSTFSTPAPLIPGMDSYKHAEGTAKETVENAKKPRIRGKGVCPFRENEIHRSIFIDPGKSIKINARLYKFTGAAQWQIVNRFLFAIANGEDSSPGHFPVKFESGDANKCKGDCKALIRDWIEREPNPNKIRRDIYTGVARFKVEKLA